MKNLISSLVLMAALCGCSQLNAVRAKPGHARVSAPQGVSQEITQPANPQDTSKQDMDITDEVVTPFFPGSVLDVPSVTTSPVTGRPVTNVVHITIPTNGAPVVMTHRHEQKSNATIGAAQPDVVGATMAKLKSSKWFSVIGVIIFVAGVGAAAYPPARLIMGGITPGIALAGAGLVISVLPYLIIGNERFLSVGIAGSLAVAAGIWFVHHNGGLAAELNTLKLTKTPVPSSPPLAASPGLPPLPL